MFGYIYLVRNKINGKQYIGQKHSDIFDETYFGSGVYIKKAIAKYGIENFEHVKILEWCINKEDLDNAERFWIDFYNAVESEDFYNLAKGGIGTIAGSKHSDDWKEKASKAATGRLMDKETRDKISSTIKSRDYCWITDGVNEKLLKRNDAQVYLTNGWSYGRLSPTPESIAKMVKNRTSPVFSEETRRKLSKANSGKNNPFYGKTHSKEQRDKWKEIRSGRVWVNKDGKATTIDKNKLNEYISNGWSKGMNKRSKIGSETIESIAQKKDLSE